MERLAAQRATSTGRLHVARSAAQRAGLLPTALALSPRQLAQTAALDAIRRSPAVQRQRQRLAALVPRGRGVVQRGKKYDTVREAAEDDAMVNGDFSYASVSDQDYVDAANELIGEYLAAGYLGHEGKDVELPQATPSKGGWGGVPGMLMIPLRDKGLNQMMGIDTFKASIGHELGHFALQGKDKQAGMKALIEPLAAKAGIAAELPENEAAKPKKAAWIEECRADLSGVYLRTVLDKAKPAPGDYESQLGAEAADGEHPPGPFRIQLIKEFLDQL